MSNRGVIDLDENAKLYTRDLLPSRPRSWDEYKKKRTTRMVRIEGPFYVETGEGTVFCPDGWLALDARGYPYPIADSEHQLIYERLETQNATDSV